MIKSLRRKIRESCKSEELRLFYFKAIPTLQWLMTLCNLEENFERIKRIYEEISLDNTMKLLLRCKRCYHLLGLLVDILYKIDEREADRDSLRARLEKSKLLGKREEEIKEPKKQERRRKDLRETMDSVQSLSDLSLLIARRIRQVQDEHKQLSRVFIFERKEFVSYLKKDLDEVKELLDNKKIEVEGLEKTIGELGDFAADSALRFAT